MKERATMAQVQQVRGNTSISETDRMQARIAELTAQNEALKASQATKAANAIKVGEKGGISVYGLARFPITLYAEQVPRFAEMLPKIAALIIAGQDAHGKAPTYKSASGEASAREWAKGVVGDGVKA